MTGIASGIYMPLWYIWQSHMGNPPGMADILILLVLVASFAAMAGYVWACRNLTHAPEAEQETDE